MAVKKDSSKRSVAHYKNHLIPSVFGGGAAYLLTGVITFGLIVFAVIWAANSFTHHLNRK